MPKKTVNVVYLLLKQDAEGNVTARQVHEADGEFAFGDALPSLAANEQAMAKNLLKSLKDKLEQP